VPRAVKAAPCVQHADSTESRGRCTAAANMLPTATGPSLKLLRCCLCCRVVAAAACGAAEGGKNSTQPRRLAFRPCLAAAGGCCCCSSSAAATSAGSSSAAQSHSVSSTAAQDGTRLALSFRQDVDARAQVNAAAPSDGATADILPLAYVQGRAATEGCTLQGGCAPASGPRAMSRKKVLLSASTRFRSACWSVLNFRHCRVWGSQNPSAMQNTEEI
jgi:hypothetical protein